MFPSMPPPPPPPPLGANASASATTAATLIPAAYAYQQLDLNRFIYTYHHMQQVNEFIHNSKSAKSLNQTPTDCTTHSQHDVNHLLSNKTNIINHSMLSAAYQMPQIGANYLALDQLNSSNLVTAKTSSYYCLTPASSTTSLNDLSNSNSLLDSFTHANNHSSSSSSSSNNKRTKRQHQQAAAPNAATASASAVTKPQNSRKRLKAAQETFDGSTIENQVPPMIKIVPVPIQPLPIQPASTPAVTNTITPSQASGDGLKRKRGRPPKSATTTITTTKPAPVVASPSVEIIAPSLPNPPHSEPVEKKIAPNKLLKPFFSKNTSNLQRSKISDNKESVPAPKLGTSLPSPVPVPSQTPQTPMPNLNWANGDELWRVMKQKEARYRHDHMYLRRHGGIEPQMRAILMDWLVEIAYAYRLHRETLHLSLEYMDRFMSQTKQQMQIDRLQLIGITSLFLAAKVEEIYPPKLRELASHMENYSSNNEEAIAQFELFMLKTLNWEISPITANTWLMAYLQIASINYHSYLLENSTTNVDLGKVHGTSLVMPLHVVKTLNQSSCSSTISVSALKKEKFYLNNYMKCITLLDLCMFDVESMKYAYSQLAAAALYHMLVDSTQLSSQSKSFNQKRIELVANLVQMCTGYRMSELDACIKWMQPYADVCKEIITEEKMTSIKQFSSVEQDDWHNIQLYYQNLDLLSEVQSRKTPSKSTNVNQAHENVLTPPESNRKNS